MKKRFALIALLVGSLSLGSLTYAAETETGVQMEAVEETEEQVQETSFTTGDAVDLTADEVVEKVSEAMSALSSLRTELIMDMTVSVQVGGDASETGMSMDMMMNMSLASDEIYEPYAAHRTETMNFSLMGMNQTSVRETYIREEDGVRVSYSGTQEEGVVTDWYRTEDAGEGMDSLFGKGNEMLDEIPNITIQDQKLVDGDGKEYYVLEGSVSLTGENGDEEIQAEVQDLLEEIQGSFGEGEIALPDSVNVTAYVSADTFEVSELSMDLSGLKGNMADTGMEGVTMTMEFSTFVIRCCLSDYNAVEEIVFPENLDAEAEEPEEEVSFQYEEPETDSLYEEGGEEDVSDLLGVSGVQDTTDTSVEFTANGTLESPAGLNEMGKAYYYNAYSDKYEQVGIQVTAVENGEAVDQYVEELLNKDNSYYAFPALRNTEEYRLIQYDLYLPSDVTDSPYGLYSPNCMFDLVGENGEWMEYNGDYYYVTVNHIYDDEGEYHPGDTVHCEAVVTVPKDLTEYKIKFGPYGLDSFYVDIR